MTTRRSSSRASGDDQGFLRPYLIGVVVLLVLGVLCLLVELQSSSLIFWTGNRVPGTNDGGIVYYAVGGEQRTLPAAGDAPAQPEPVVVYASPTDQTKDRLASSVRWFDAAFVLGPFVVAGALVLTGLYRRRRFRARQAAG